MQKIKVKLFTPKFSLLARRLGQEKFVGVERLLTSRRDNLTARQSRLVELHAKAVEAFKKFQKTGAYVHEAGNELSDAPRSPLEKPALTAGEKAMEHFVKYYASHGRTEEGFKALKKTRQNGILEFQAFGRPTTKRLQTGHAHA